ncbi:complement factor H-like [Lissotriton helveticus]
MMAAALTPPMLLLLLLPSLTAGHHLQGPGPADSGGPGRTIRALAEQCRFPESSILISEQSKLYYGVGETTGVRCTEGYEPSVPVLRCVRRGSAAVFDSDVTCIEQCRIPEGSKLISEQSKLYYGAGETTGVRCIEGFEPSEPVLRCVRRGAANVWEPDVTCIEQCRIPEGSKLISEQSKLYYGAGETTGVRCIEGYEPSEPVLRCVRRGAANVWEPDVTCIEQCRFPERSNLISEQSRLYYRAGETTGLRCTEGYKPSVPVLRCVRRGAAIDWDSDVTCIGGRGSRITEGRKTGGRGSRITEGPNTGGPGSRITEGPNTGTVEMEEGPSFTVFNAIQVAQIVVLLLSVTVTSLLCKRGTSQSTTTDYYVYINTVS